jgi:sec-independent protein translocase protein TatC
MSAFDLRLQVSIFLGLLLTSPFWLYHLWAFITPALRKRERRYTLAFLLTSVPLFSAGAWLAWVSLPTFMSTLLAFTPEGATNIINAKDYILFNLRILLVFGLAFVMPVVLVLLNLANLITAKSIFKSWRVALFVIAVISAIATPTADPLSMFVLMVPLAALYLASGAIATVFDRRRAKRAVSLDQELES